MKKNDGIEWAKETKKYYNIYSIKLNFIWFDCFYMLELRCKVKFWNFIF